MMNSNDSVQAKETSSLLGRLMAAIPAPLFYKDASGVYIECNEAFCLALRRTREEIIGHSVFDIAPANLAKISHEADLALLEQDKKVHYESWITNDDGSTRSVIFHKAPFAGFDGLPAGIIGIIIDNTKRREAERALEAELVKHKILFDQSPDGVLIIDPATTRFLDFNEAAHRQLGYTREEFAQLCIHDVEAKETKDETTKTVQAVIQKGKFDFDTIQRTKQGEHRDVHVTAQNIDINGQPMYFCTWRDITERKQAEDALKKSEANYRQLFENSPAAIYQIDFRTGKISKANDIFREYLGCNSEEIIKLNLFDIMTDVSRKLFLERIDKMARHEEVPDKVEYEIVDKKGITRWVLLHNKNIYDAAGHVVASDVVAHDITERKVIEEKLRRSEDRFIKVSKQAREMTWEIDADGICTYISPVCQMLLGYDPSEIEGKKYFYDFQPAADRESFKRIVQKFFAERKSFKDYRNQLVAKDGRVVQTLTNGEPIFNQQGDFIGYCGSHFDITVRIQLEQEKAALEEKLHRSEKMEALGTLAGGVAHDLNNVLGVIVGYSELTMLKANDNHPLQENILKIQKSAERATAIVQDLLTLARRGVNNNKVLNLNRMIVECKKSAEFERLALEHPEVQVRAELEPRLLNISGSQVHLTKSYFNLLSNAGDAMKDGGVLTIKTFNQYLDRPLDGYDTIKEGDYVVLSIADTGEGISEDDIRHIFEPFYTKKIMGKSGTGLGLSVVWGTVKDHNGYINVQSEKGKGSTFTLYFPVVREEISEEKIEVSISEYMGKGESILVIDDVEEQRILATKLLSELGYVVASVDCGEKAIEHLRRNSVDLLLLDMIMDPGIDGLDTYREIVKDNPGQKAIIVSGFSETKRIRQAQELGAGTYVKKPYIIEVLGLAIREELARK